MNIRGKVCSLTNKMRITLNLMPSTTENPLKPHNFSNYPYGEASQLFSKSRSLYWATSPIYPMPTRYQFLNAWHLKQVVSLNLHTPILPLCSLSQRTWKELPSTQKLTNPPTLLSFTVPSKSSELSLLETSSNLSFPLASNVFSFAHSSFKPP